MNMVQQKISKTSKSISLILVISSVLVALAIILFAIGIYILTFANGTTTFSLQKAFTTLTSTGIIKVPSIQNLSVLFLLCIVQLIILFVIFYILHQMFLNISIKYTPFEKQQVNRLKQVAFFTLIMCFASSITDIIGRILLYEIVAFKFNIMCFVLAIVIYCLAYIFDYGSQLQKQSDETL